LVLHALAVSIQPKRQRRDKFRDLLHASHSPGPGPVFPGKIGQRVSVPGPLSPSAAARGPNRSPAGPHTCRVFVKRHEAQLTAEAEQACRDPLSCSSHLSRPRLRSQPSHINDGVVVADVSAKQNSVTWAQPALDRVSGVVSHHPGRSWRPMFCIASQFVNAISIARRYPDSL
jgi:hypothetical protein